MELLKPVKRVCHQEVLDLGATKVEYVGTPIRVVTPARVSVLIERFAIKPGQCPVVLGEVSWHPVHDHANSSLVQLIN